MARRGFFLIIAFLAGPAAPAGADIAVRGRVIGADGAPLDGAYVSLIGAQPRVRFETDASGRFATSVDTSGGHFLWVAAEKHLTLNMPVLVVSEPVDIEVHLGTPDYLASPDSVFVIGDFNQFDASDGRVMMEPAADGTFAADIPVDADTLACQLVGIHDGDYPVSGTGGDRIAFSRGRPLIAGRSGQYAAVFDVVNGIAPVTFDPTRLPPAGAPTDVRFADALSTAARIYELNRDLESRRGDFKDAYIAHRNAGGDPQEFQFDWASDRAAVLDRLDGETNRTVRDYLLINFFTLDPQDSDSLLARRVFTDVPPNSPAWELLWGGPHNVLFQITRIARSDAASDDYCGRVATSHRNRGVRGAFLSNMMGRAAAAGEERRAAQIAAVLQDDYGQTMYAQLAKRYAAERVIAPGKPVPAFSLTALGDSTTAYSDETLRGHVYLIDFWAVWCGPCRVEMPFLHDAYEKYADTGFTILSISFDRKPLQVGAYRADKWPMPWLHAYVENGFSSEIAKTFEVVGIPRTVLVGKDGTILAADGDLRGQRLDQTLQRVIGNPGE